MLNIQRRRGTIYCFHSIYIYKIKLIIKLPFFCAVSTESAQHEEISKNTSFASNRLNKDSARLFGDCPDNYFPFQTACYKISDEKVGSAAGLGHFDL